MFPLAAAQEDSVRDPRIDELILVVEQLFNLYARLLERGGARQGRRELMSEAAAPSLRRLAAWWDRFASVEVSDVRRRRTAARRRRPPSTCRARCVCWHERGETAGRLGLLAAAPGTASARPRPSRCVVDALLRKEDYRRGPGPAHELAGPGGAFRWRTAR